MAQVVHEISVETPVQPLGEGEARVKGRSLWELFVRRFRKDRFAMWGLAMIAALVIVAIAAPVFASITGHGVNYIPNNLAQVLNQYGVPYGPSAHFWFGVDTFGHDAFVRVIYGARTSLIVAFLATGIQLVLGVILGLLAGYYRGRIDTVIMRITDIVMSLPVLVLALGLVAACGTNPGGCLGGAVKPGLVLVCEVIGFFGWPYIARIVRGQTMSLREREFVQAANAMGASDWRIVFKEILPNVMAPVLVYTTLIIPNNIIFEATLSFLGIGVPPTTASWGQMISNVNVQAEPWLMIYPGFFLFLTTLAFNLVGDGMQDALNPRGVRS